MGILNCKATLSILVVVLISCLKPYRIYAEGFESDRTLKTIVTSALRRSLSVRNQVYAEEQALISKKNAWAGLLPTVSLSASRGWFRSESEGDREKIRTSRDSNGLSISGEWTLWDHAESWRSVYLAELSHDASRLNLDKEKEMLVTQVVENYLKHLLLVNRAELAKKYYEQSRDTHMESEILLKAGAITAIEAIDSEIQVLNAERDQMEALSDLKNSERSLRALLNLEEQDQINTVPLLEVKPYYTDSFDKTKLAMEKKSAGQIVQGSLDDRLGQLSLKQSLSEYRQAQWNYWPRLGLTMSHSWNMNDWVNKGTDNYRPVLEDTSVSLSLSWSLWDWFSSGRNVRSAELGYLTATNTYLNTRRVAVAEIENLLSQYEILVKSVEASKLSLEKSRKQLEGSRELHKLGRINLLLMQQSTNRYFEAETSYAERVQTLYVAMARVMFVSGASLLP